MLNVLLFLASCALMVAFAWFSFKQGQSALTAWVVILSLSANLFVLKQIQLFGLNATAGDVFAIGSLLALNLLQEKFGAQAAQQAIWTSFSCLLFFVIMSQIHLWYLPSSYDESKSAYLFLLSPAPRIILASLVTFLIVQQCDLKLYGTFRKYFNRLSPLWISAITMTISQLLDTVLFALLGLYGMLSALTELIITSYGIKLIAIASTIPWHYLSRKYFYTPSSPNTAAQS